MDGGKPAQIAPIQPHRPSLAPFGLHPRNRSSTQADQLVGAVLLAVAVAVFSYYTVWVMVLVRCLPAHVHASTNHQPRPT